LLIVVVPVDVAIVVVQVAVPGVCCIVLVALHQLPLLPTLLNVPLLLRLPPGRPAIEVTTIVSATANHIY
jgi:hypothetical protein